MYNPVNMHVEAEERLKEKDLREKNKKRRYEVRYDYEQVNRKDDLAQQDRLEHLKLSKIKYERVQEEVDRGFNIITNGELPPGLSHMEQGKYMKPAVGVWKQMGHNEEDKKASSRLATIDLVGMDLQTRSRRYALHSPKLIVDVQKPPSHAASLPKSHASAHPSSHASAKPNSHASMKPPSHAAASQTSSKRAIRTGAFQKMGHEIVTN
jgi:hypothetical protein